MSGFNSDTKLDLQYLTKLEADPDLAEKKLDVMINVYKYTVHLFWS